MKTECCKKCEQTSGFLYSSVCDNPSCECHQSCEWKKEFDSKFNIAYVHDKGWAFLKEEVKEFISSERQRAYEEGFKDSWEKRWDANGSPFKAGRQVAYTELLAKMPKEEEFTDSMNDLDRACVANFNEALSAIRDLIEKKQHI